MITVKYNQTLRILEQPYLLVSNTPSATHCKVPYINMKIITLNLCQLSLSI